MKHFLDSISLLSSGTNYFRELKEVIDKINYETKSNSYNTSGYCDQNMSKVLMWGGYNSKQNETVKIVYQIDENKLKKVK